jgi:hypothetical protein
MNRADALLACLLFLAGLCAGFASSALAQGSPVQARVFVARDATDQDVLRIRDNILTFGGTVKGYARGEVFVIVVRPEMLAAIASVQGVARVDLVPTAGPVALLQDGGAAPLSARARAALMPKNCVSTPTPAEAERLARSVKPSPKVTPTPFSRRRSLLSGVTTLPPSVDNSLSPHFPPIGDQDGRNSCVAWASGYYWSTYTQAADEGLDVSGTWLPRDAIGPPRPSRALENIASPAFSYPLIRRTGRDPVTQGCFDDGGALIADAMVQLNIWGVGSWQMKSYDPWQFDSVAMEWPTEAQWVEALRRRTAQTFVLQLGDPAVFEDLKQHLANGDLAVAGFTQYENLPYWGWDRACQSEPGACPGIDSDVLFSNAGNVAPGLHAITIVGYDDDKEYFDAEARQLKRGALLIANSASADWGIPNTGGGTSRGFFWMAYEFARVNLYEVSYNTDRAAHRARLYVAARVSAPDRTSGKFHGGVGFQADSVAFYWTESPYAKYVTPENVFAHVSDCVQRPIESDKRLVIDLTDGWSTIGPGTAVPLLFVTFNSYLSSTMGPTDFFFDRTGTGTFTRLGSPDPVKSATPDVQDAVMCTAVTQSGDVTGDGIVDRADINAITAGLSRPSQCVSDPRDMDRDSRITVMDARKAVTRCTYPRCVSQ